MRTFLFVVIATASFPYVALGQLPDPPGQVTGNDRPVFDAYLFAHMTHADYGRLYYSVSTDGLRWRPLNGGRRVFDSYRGHPDICRGHDGQYYLVGNRSDEAPEIDLWTSSDLIDWKELTHFTPDLKHVPNYSEALPAIGAPKIFFDRPNEKYLITWHTPHNMKDTKLPEPYWASQRTLYVTSSDLRTFSQPPRKLFPWDMATIDVIIRREGDEYFAVMKDERYPTLEWPTGKTIRISRGPSLLGPYSHPGPALSPNFRKAPALIPSPNGRAWYLYYEQYPGVSYGLSVSDSLRRKGFQVSGNTFHLDWDKFRLPRQVRHGSMLPITEEEYRKLVDTFGISDASNRPSRSN